MSHHESSEPEVLQSGFGGSVWAQLILGTLPANVSANFDGDFPQNFQPCFSRIPPPQKKTHAQNCRHSSPISLSWTQNSFTPIFCSQWTVWRCHQNDMSCDSNFWQNRVCPLIAVPFWRLPEVSTPSPVVFFGSMCRGWNVSPAKSLACKFLCSHQFKRAVRIVLCRTPWKGELLQQHEHEKAESDNLGSGPT